MKFWIHLPCWNLGCLGITICSFYADLDVKTGHLYVNWFKRGKYASHIKHFWRWRYHVMDPRSLTNARRTKESTQKDQKD
jgi:hypothetical protein